MKGRMQNLEYPYQGPSDSLGTWILSFAKYSDKNIKYRVYLFTAFCLPLFSVLFGFLGAIFSDIPWLNWAAAVSGIASLIAYLAFFKYFAKGSSSSGILGYLIDPDFIALGFLCAMTIEHMIDRFQNSDFWIFFGIFMLAWILVQAWTAARWKKFSDHHFKRQDFFWKNPLLVAEKYRQILFILSLVVFSSAWILFYNGHQVSRLLLALIPVSLPLFLELTTRLLADADQNDFYCGNWSQFLNLRKIKSLILHQHGILTEPVQKVCEIWIDQNDVFQEGEIQEALALISRRGNHPICKLLSDTLKKETRLLKLVHSEEKSHLGITAELEGLDREHITAHFGTLTWQKILKHEISETGMQVIRTLRLNRDSFSLLSLNRSVVAVISWNNTPKAQTLEGLKELKAAGISVSMISSQIYKSDEWSEEVLKDSAIDLLPIERPVHFERWIEREPRVAIVQCGWDELENPNLPRILVCQRTSELTDCPLSFFRFNPRSLNWLIRASTRYSKGLVMVSTSSFMASLVALAIPGVYFSSLFVLAYGMLSAAFFTRFMQPSRLDSKN